MCTALDVSLSNAGSKDTGNARRILHFAYKSMNLADFERMMVLTKLV